MPKFNIGDIVYVTDSERYTNYKFKNTRGQIVWLSKIGDFAENVAGVHFEGIYNTLAKDGRFYFPVESLKGETKMPATNKFHIGDEVYFPNSKPGEKLYARSGIVKEVYHNNMSNSFLYVVDIKDFGEVHAFEEVIERIERVHKINFEDVLTLKEKTERIDKINHSIRYSKLNFSEIKVETIDRVLFNPPATIIFWKDKSKTIVKCKPNEEFDPEKGLAMAITKKALGNKHDYYDVFWKFLPKEYKKALKKKNEFEPCEAGYDEKEIMCHTCPEKEACEEMVKEFLSKSKGLKEIIDG